MVGGEGEGVPREVGEAEVTRPGWRGGWGGGDAGQERRDGKEKEDGAEEEDRKEGGEREAEKGGFFRPGCGTGEGHCWGKERSLNFKERERRHLLRK